MLYIYLEQEVLLYPHIDLNNIWTIYKHGEIWNSSLPVEFVRNHDTVRLEHFASTRKLHSHDIPAPVSAQKKEHNEVS
jgi:dolichyl-phosphate-mannose--protein O-mannosyl transferase